ncbi:MAG: sigma-54 dependent transcriptional regulator [Gammaproteobacteria bacterium]|nr:sigma-54 dependent transcriptional regulator [Gammaproteobacteria bacterium]
MIQVLLVENDSERRAALNSLLQSNGFSVVEAQTAGINRGALEGLDVDGIDCIVAAADLLPHLGVDILDQVPVVLVDHDGDARQAVAAMKGGAADYIVAPFNADELVAAVERAQTSAPESGGGPLNMVGASKPMLSLFELIAKVAPTDSTVLIEGESGTGKELVARALHAASTRRQAPLITLNCATIPAQLIESELFGHPENHSADPRPALRRGLLDAADGGTLFLDEICELPLEVQARLLRVLQDGELREFGTTAARRIDVRLITATHRDLRRLMATGQFRDDLYYRLNVVNVVIPPLRQRGDDVLRLADTILNRTAERLSKSCSGFTESAKDAMLAYRWPGNVRELENAIERAVILCSGAEIESELLAIDLAPTLEAEDNPPASDHTSLEDYFVSFVTENQDQLTETELASKLGISRKSLWERRQRLNIPRKKTRKRGPRRNTP